MSNGDDRAERVRRAADAVARLAATSLLDEQRRARAAGLALHSVDAMVLGLLRLHGPCTPRDLAGHLGIRSSGTITGAVDRLERAGWVARTPCRVDRRKVFVTLADGVAHDADADLVASLEHCTDAALAAVADVLDAVGPAHRA